MSHCISYQSDTQVRFIYLCPLCVKPRILMSPPEICEIGRPVWKRWANVCKWGSVNDADLTHKAAKVLGALCEVCGVEVHQWIVLTKHALPWWSWSPRSLSHSASCTHCFWFSSPALNQTGWRRQCTAECATSIQWHQGRSLKFSELTHRTVDSGLRR